MKARGEFKRAQRRARARQRIYDAVKALRAGAPVTVIIRQGPQQYVEFDVEPLADVDRGNATRVLYVYKGFVGAATVSCKDATEIIPDLGSVYAKTGVVVGRITAERVLPPRPPV